METLFQLPGMPAVRGRLPSEALQPTGITFRLADINYADASVVSHKEPDFKRRDSIANILSEIFPDVMIKVAIAGTGGLAQYIAHFISSSTQHQFILLSRNPNPGLLNKGWQILKVDYDNSSHLLYALAGVDTVISTVPGPAELALIDAAVQVGVRRFIPSEFEGSPSTRPSSSLLDRGDSNSLAKLQQYRDQYGMEYTAFVCGIFYERFAPGGLAAFQLGSSLRANGEGDYILNVRKMKAQAPYYNPAGELVRICMTSVEDVARAVVAALDLPLWPAELRICGDRMTLADIVTLAENMCGRGAEQTRFTQETLENSLAYAKATADTSQQWHLHSLMATASGCYDFDNPNLLHFVDLRPKRFREWFRLAWCC